MPDADALKLALQSVMTAWAVTEVRGEQARVRRVPELLSLDAELSAVDAHWGLTWQCDSLHPPVVRARLSVLGRVREGLSQGYTLADARALALAGAFALYGVTEHSDAGHWVEYDPEEGPNTSELQSPQDAAPSAARAYPEAASTLPPEAPKDPQMEKAKTHIDQLMEMLRAGGLGKEAAQIVLRHGGGYGKDVAESRAIYKELQGLQRT